MNQEQRNRVAEMVDALFLNGPLYGSEQLQAAVHQALYKVLGPVPDPVPSPTPPASDLAPAPNSPDMVSLEDVRQQLIGGALHPALVVQLPGMLQAVLDSMATSDTGAVNLRKIRFPLHLPTPSPVVAVQDGKGFKVVDKRGKRGDVRH